MKKILLLFLVSLTLVACGKESNPKPSHELDIGESYKEAVDKLLNADPVDITMNVKLADSNSEEEFNLNRRSSIINLKDTQKAQVYYSMSFGEEKISSYVKDGFVYVDINGDKTKQPYKLADDSIGQNTSLFDSIITDEAAIKALKLTKEGDNFVYTLEIDSHEKILQVLESLKSSLIDSFKDEDFVYQKLGVKAVVSSDLELLSYTLVLEAKDMSTDTIMTSEISMVVNAYGDKVKIDFPDFTEYKEGE